jgi:hypothetical protein
MLGAQPLATIVRDAVGKASLSARAWGKPQGRFAILDLRFSIERKLCRWYRTTPPAWEWSFLARSWGDFRGVR